jgi:alanyl-tRNA synthetase
VAIDDARRPLDRVVAHLGRVRVGTIRVGDEVEAAVDAGRRRQITRHHTATHLLNKALEELLGQRNLQRGSWVGPDHTTFDFPFDRPLTPDELERLTARINDEVRAALPLEVRVLPYDEAIATGATHLFDERYGDTVRVVCFGTWSCEFCGGTHCATTADVAPVLILSESSIGQGLRRIDMVVGKAAENVIRMQQSELQELTRDLSVAPDQVSARVAALQRELRDDRRQMDRLRDEVRQAHVRGGSGDIKRRDARIPLVLEHVPADGMDDLRGYADRYLEALGGSGVVGVANDVNFVIKISRNLADRYDATKLVRLVGRGGGRPELAQGRLGKPAEDALRDLEEALR